ncbi:MAG TPA: hypothetical protein VMA83_10350 [Solirubrobacteraceae bacterium]|nr:hypothetical protein [Solirubrobacteraceae bacterium]
MALSAIDGMKDDEPDRTRRAWLHVAAGYEAALTELEPGDDDYGRMLRGRARCRLIAGEATLGMVS